MANTGAGSAPTSPRTNPKASGGRYGSLFRSTQSCANLEHMESHKYSEPDHMQTLKESTATQSFFTRSLFRSVKSCINLEGMDQSTGPPSSVPQHVDSNPASSSGILFSAVKAFKVKPNMVSERDINLMAPMSS